MPDRHAIRISAFRLAPWKPATVLRCSDLPEQILQHLVERHNPAEQDYPQQCEDGLNQRSQCGSFDVRSVRSTRKYPSKAYYQATVTAKGAKSNELFARTPSVRNALCADA